MSTFKLHEKLAADTHQIARLDLSEVLLMNDTRFPWLILVPRIEGARELHKLSVQQRDQLAEEIQTVSESLDQLFQPYKLNVATLGNQVEQLHIHVIARFQEDDAWPAPVWGYGSAQPYSEAQAEEVIQRIAATLIG